MRLMLLSSLVVSLLAQSPGGPFVGPAFRYPKSSQINVIAQVHKVRAIRGSVKGMHGVQIAGRALVELVRGPDDEGRLDARLCDESGAFDFGRKKKGRYYLKVSLEGWDTLYVPVWLGSHGERTLNLELQLSN